MSEDLRALPSEFRGVTFRSRTEARWAVFFHALELEAEHEKQGYDVDGRWYLPDFYLPQLRLWWEVKPDETDESDLEHFAKLCRLSERSGVIAYGAPGPAKFNLLFFDHEQDEFVGRYRFLADRRDEQIYWLGGDPKEGQFTFVIGGPGQETEHDRWPIVTSALSAAFAAAANEKFGT